MYIAGFYDISSSLCKGCFDIIFQFVWICLYPQCDPAFGFSRKVCTRWVDVQKLIETVFKSGYVHRELV